MREGLSDYDSEEAWELKMKQKKKRDNTRDIWMRWREAYKMESEVESRKHSNTIDDGEPER